MNALDPKNIIATSETKEIASKISNIIGNLEFVDENNTEFSLSKYIGYLLKAAENCDAALRAEIENNIVKLGIKTVPYLINSLMTVKGAARGLAAMAIIRMGGSTIEILKNTASKTPDFAWMAEYIINEIVGTQIPVVAYNEEQQNGLIAV
ncbi:MAG: hypothetical protein A2039_03810 [Candidatus Melainabacteria bacterium GWA2_34_9]|nr:MAG: hypothetical protein A2039_03810 [Candidatus Melainabacteria bacterium GWA2_34_9]